MKLFVLAILALSLLLAAQASQAETEYIPAAKYFETTLAEINSAKESIRLTMYLVSVRENETGWLSTRLVDALVKAKERGVKVEAILDQNYDFGEGAPNRDNLKVKNLEAYEILKKNGVAVSYDTPEIATHSKVLVIDGETVILGSTNWSNAALSTNNEANVLIRSKDVARAVLEDQKSIRTEAPRVDAAGGVALSWEFTNRKELLGRMVSRQDERAFDVYLYLLKEYDGNAEAKVVLDHDKLAQALGIDSMASKDYRRQIIKVLEKLQDEYRLISAETRYGKDSEVILKNYADPDRLYAAPEEKYLFIPKNYWAYGWDKRLGFAGKVMTLINLSYAAVSPQAPRWYSTVAMLSERHHVSQWFISEGTTALRKADLVEVEYDEIGREGNPDRLANVYLPNALYDPAERQRGFEELEKVYGPEKYAKAREYAKVVYEDDSLGGVKTLLELDRLYGPEVIRRAVDAVSVKNPDNPKRSMRYLVSTVKGMAGRER